MKILKRTLVLSLVCFLLLPTLFSCARDESETVFQYGDTRMSEKMFIYELSAMKTELLSENGITGTDIPEVWVTEVGEGTTYDDLIYAQCQANICSVIYFADYAKTHGGGLTEEDNAAVQKTLDDLTAQMGSKKAVNNYLKTYGIDYDIYREYLELYSLYYKGVNLAYAEGGEHAFTESEIMDYYEKNFVTVKHVAVGTELAGADEEGNYIYFTDEEKAEKQKKIENIRQSLADGADFDEFYLESEDGQALDYPNGYTITSGVMGDEMKGYEEVALSLDVGEVGEWEKEGISHYFIKRVDLLESDVENCAGYITSVLMQQDMLTTVFEHYDEFTMNEEIIDSYNMASALVMK